MFAESPFASVPFAVISSVSGVAYTLTADAGAYTYTGANATLIKGRKLPANAGAYTYTGVAATLTYATSFTPYMLSCARGRYSYAGKPADLEFILRGWQLVNSTQTTVWTPISTS